MAKTGRKPKPFICPWNNEPVHGLYKLPNGNRWRIVATGERFTSDDPRQAVAKFRAMEARRKGLETLLPIPLTHDGPDADPDLAGALEAVLRHDLGPGEHRTPADPSLVLNIPPGTDPMVLLRAVPTDVLWSHFTSEIHARRQWVAERTGIEWIGYGPDLPKPTPSPTLTAVAEFYYAKNPRPAGDNWRVKQKAFWSEFCEAVDVTRLRDVTQQAVVDYADAVEEAMREHDRQPTYAKQRYTAVKAILNYPPKKAKWSEDCARVSAFCKVLTPPEKSKKKPVPIARDDYRAVLAAATGDMHALLLVMLNCCMYGGEAATLEWGDLNLDAGELSGRRGKTGIVRVAKLWPRTVEALRAVKRTASPSVFLTEAGTTAGYLTTHRAFKAIRTAIGLPGVQLAHVRDGAYTSAVRAGVPLHLCQMLAGHATGMADAYVLRDPSTVADACAAIERAYFG